MSLPTKEEAEERVARLYTAKHVSAESLGAWRRQYKDEPSDFRFFDGTTLSSMDAAIRGADGDPDKLAAVHGGKSGWSHPQCTGCHEYVDAVAIVGEDWDGNDVQICASCARAALASLKDHDNGR